MKTLRLLALLLCSLAPLLHAQTGLTRLGEFKVNSTTSGDQIDAVVAAAANGDFVVVWMSPGQDGDQGGIYARLYNAAGSPRTDEFKVNESTGGNQQLPSVAMAPSGEFVVVWQSSGIYGRRYTAAGVARDAQEFLVNSPASSGFDQRSPSVAMDENGNFVATWTSYGQEGGASIYFQRFRGSDAFKLGLETRAHDGTGGTVEGAVIGMNLSGQFVIVWRSPDNSSLGVFGRAFESDGSKVNGDGSFRANDDSPGFQEYGSVAVREDGSFIVVWWDSAGRDGSGSGIFGQRFLGDAARTKDGGNFAVNTQETNGEQVVPVVAADSSGNFTVLWRSQRGGAAGEDLIARRFDAQGTPLLEGEFTVNSLSDGDQRANDLDKAITYDGAGNLIAVWWSRAIESATLGIHAEKFFVAGQGPPLSEFRVNTTTTGDQKVGSVASAPDGRFVVVWESTAPSVSPRGIIGQRYGANGQREGSEFPVSTSGGDHSLPDVGINNSGDFVVAWQGPSAGDGDGTGILARRFSWDLASASAQFQVNTTTTTPQRDANVAMVTDGQDGRFAIVWTDTGPGFGQVRMQFYNAGTNPTRMGSEIEVSPRTTANNPSITFRAPFGYAVAWIDFGFGGGSDVFTRQFDTNGNPIGVTNEADNGNDGNQYIPVLGFTSDGTFVIAWENQGTNGNGDANGSGIFGRRLGADGLSTSAIFPINGATSGNQFQPSLVMLPNDQWLVAYGSRGFDGSNDDVALQRLDLNGNRLGETQINLFAPGNQTPAQLQRSIAADALGNYIVVWQSENQDGSGYGVYATKVFLYPEVTVTPQDASAVTDTTATLNGTVNANGDTATVKFDYGATAALGTTVTLMNPVTGTSDTPVSTMLTGLSPGQTIYFRVRASSSGREVVGETRSFSTQIVPPVVSVPVQTGRTDTTASLEVTVNPRGTATSVLLEYRLEPPVNVGDPFTPTMAQDCQNGQADVTKTFTITGLTASRTYTVRAKATNTAAMTSTSADATFTTSGPPDVVTGGTTGLMKTSVTLNGTVNPFGIPATAFFEYGLTDSYGQSTTPQAVSAGTTAMAVSAAIAGLEPNTTYHYRLVGTSGAGGAQRTDGDDATFTTLPDPPLVTTATEANVTATGALLRGAVDPKGRATDYFFQWGATDQYGMMTPTQSLPAGNGSVDVSAVLSGLASGGTYHFRLVAMNAAGMAVGVDRSFVAMNPGGGDNPTAAPTVTTGAASAIEQTTATLGGTVNPNGGTTLAQFEYGTTTAYGSTSAAQGLGNGTTAANVSANIAGLAPGTLYHYRLVATNSLDTTPGLNGMFTTKFPPPTVTIAAPTGADLGATFATLRGTVNPNGLPTTGITFEYGRAGESATAEAVTGSLTGSTAQPVEVEIEGLVPGAEYYFRLTASHAQGQSQTGDTAFTTLAAQTPLAGDDYLFVDTRASAVSLDLLANDVNRDFPPTTNTGLTFVDFIGLTNNRSADDHGTITRVGAATVNYDPDENFPFTRGLISPPAEDTFQYEITTAAPETAIGTVRVFHFLSFKGSYGGAITAGSDTDGGTLTLELTGEGNFTAKLSWQSVDYTLRTKLDGSGQLPLPARQASVPKKNRDNTLVPGKNLVVTLQLDPTDSHFDGTLLDQETNRPFPFTLFRATPPDASDPKFEIFTTHLEQPPLALAEGAPRGSISPFAVTGFGNYLAKLSKGRGKFNAKLRGNLADRTPFGSGTKIFNDRLLLNNKLYGRGRNARGQVFGETTLARGQSFTSTLEWIKRLGLLGAPAELRSPQTRGRTRAVPGELPVEFHNSLNVVGDLYLTAGENAVQLFSDFGRVVEVRFSAGGLPVDPDYESAQFTLEQTQTGFRVIPGGKTFAGKVTFKVVPSDGRFSGTFVHPDPRYTKPVKFSGSFRRGTGPTYAVGEKGRGSFLGFENAGFVRVFKVE